MPHISKITLQDVAIEIGMSVRQLHKYKSGAVKIKAIKTTPEAYDKAKDEYLRDAKIGVLVVRHLNAGVIASLGAKLSKRAELERLVGVGRTYGAYLNNDFIKSVVE